MKAMRFLLVLGLLLAASTVLSNTPPEVTNVAAVQRPHTALVDVTYDLLDDDGDLCHVSLWYSLDGGASWDHECTTVWGDVGPGITPGTGLVATWDAGVDEPDFASQQFSIRVYADDGGGNTPVLWETDFEGICPNGWALEGDWECGVPSSTPGPGYTYSGVQCLATRLDGNYSNDQAWSTATATSPAIDLTGASQPQLSFRMWIHTEGSTYDGANLKISTNGGHSFSLLVDVTPAYGLTVDGQSAWGGNQSAAGWQLVTANLAEYAGLVVHLQFAFRSDGTVNYAGVYVDDVMITD